MTIGFDDSSNVAKYSRAVDSLLQWAEGGDVLVLGENVRIFVHDSLLGKAPLLFKADTFPIIVKAQSDGSENIFIADVDTGMILVIYATPYNTEETERTYKLPTYETVEDGYLFNIKGKKVLVLRSIKRKQNYVYVVDDTLALKGWWPTLDSLLNLTSGKSMIFLGALKVKVDGVPYGQVDIIRNVTPGVHRVEADGIGTRVRSYITLDSVDVVVFLMDRPPDNRGNGGLFYYAPPRSKGTHRLMKGCIGAFLGGVLGISSCYSPVACILGSIIGFGLGYCLI
ncbi:MAG: hypothetical protein GXO39_03260 [Thermotogae bacterium]|nr:hypothetical protein [Thermotogota bacterium]